jgi:hypothetical protein
MTYREEGKRETCEHGASGEACGIDSAALNDPSDLGIMAFYSACDCCGTPMHNSAPYQYVPEDGRTLCFSCRDFRYPMPLDSWGIR